MANTLLFFDDQNLNILTNIKRVLIRPKLIGNPYSNDSEGLVSLAWGYPFVFFSNELKKYVMYYQGWSRDRSKIETALTMAAVSDDGFNFKELNFTPFMPNINRIVINQVLPYELNGGILSEAQFFYLDKLNSEYKFISLCLLKLPDGTNKAITFESLDGLRWHYKENAYWHDGDDAPDYPLSVYYNDMEQCYVLIKRPAHCDRRVSLATTNDFINFSKQELIMQPDTLDVPLTDMYGMYGFNYKGNYLGLVMLYHTPNYLRFNDFKTSGLDTHKFYGGKVGCQWSYSANGKHYMRSFRDPIIGGGIDNFACAYPTSLLCRDKKIYIYASLSKEEHGYITEGKSAIGCYEFREDGFIALESENGFGYLCSKGLFLESEDISFNIECPVGEVKIQVSKPNGTPYNGFSFEDCIPFIGDSTKHFFTFKSGKAISNLVGKVIVIEMIINQGKLYSISGNFFKLNPYEVKRWYDGIKPTKKVGL